MASLWNTSNPAMADASDPFQLPSIPKVVLFSAQVIVSIIPNKYLNTEVSNLDVPLFEMWLNVALILCSWSILESQKISRILANIWT